MRYRRNPALAQQLRRSPDTAAALLAKANDVADEAQSIARRDAYDTGAYHDSIAGAAGAASEGVIGRVNVTDFKAHWIERGYTRQDGVHVPGKNILRRAADAAGLTTERR